jgi:hypothetical protein
MLTDRQAGRSQSERECAARQHCSSLLLLSASREQECSEESTRSNASTSTIKYAVTGEADAFYAARQLDLPRLTT